MKPLFILRPEPGWSVSAETARAMDLEVHGKPLFDIEPVGWSAPDPAQYDGLLVGSANVFRHGGDALEKFARLPVHAVGEATAGAAGAAGFLIGRTGQGGLQVLLDKLAGRKLRLLRLAGEDRVPLKVPDGISVDTETVYRAVPNSLDDKEVPVLASGAVVALHSGSAATRFKEECERLSIDRSRIDIAAIGPRVAEMVGEEWNSVHTAASTDDGALLELARSLCQTAD